MASQDLEAVLVREAHRLAKRLVNGPSQGLQPLYVAVHGVDADEWHGACLQDRSAVLPNYCTYQ
jgi:hypothetical protein